jgi:hypothetical protein
VGTSGTHRQALDHPLRTAAPIGQHPTPVLAGVLSRNHNHLRASVCCCAREDGANRGPAGTSLMRLARWWLRTRLRTCNSSR